MHKERLLLAGSRSLGGLTLGVGWLCVHRFVHWVHTGKHVATCWRSFLRSRCFGNGFAPRVSRVIACPHVEFSQHPIQRPSVNTRGISHLLPARNPKPYQSAQTRCSANGWSWLLPKRNMPAGCRCRVAVASWLHHRLANPETSALRWLTLALPGGRPPAATACGQRTVNLWA